LATPSKRGSFSRTVPTSAPSSAVKSPTKSEALSSIRKAMAGTDIAALEQAIADLTLVDPTSTLVGSAKQKLLDLQKLEQQRAARAESEKAAEEARAKAKAEREKEEAAYAVQRARRASLEDETKKKEAEEKKKKLEELKASRGISNVGATAGSASMDAKRKKN